MNMRRIASVMFIVSACMVMTTGLWIFILVAREYTALTAGQIWMGAGSNNVVQKYIPSTACYTTFAIGCLMLGNAIAAMFCTGGAVSKSGYETGSYTQGGMVMQ